MQNTKGDGNNVINIETINGKVKKITQDNSKHYYMNSNQSYFHGKIEKEETTIKQIIKEKLIELILGFIFGIITYLPTFIKDKINFSSVQTIFIIFLSFITLISAFVFLFSFLFSIINILKLRKSGAFIEFASKKYLFKLALHSFSKDNSENIIRTTGSIYSNTKGKIYKLTFTACPICKVKPFGKMSFRYDNVNKRYFLKCNENPEHILFFDYKAPF